MLAPVKPSHQLSMIMIVCTLLLVFLGLPICGKGEDWPCWRGPRQDGTSMETNVPIHWSASSNVIGKVAGPGVGHASPIIQSKYVFIVSATAATQDRLMLCFERQTGTLV